VRSRIDEIDLSKKMGKEESEKRVLSAQHRLTQLRLFSAGLLAPDSVGPGLLVLFEGFDAAGKGGAIRRLTSSLDPRHVHVVPISAPTPTELAHVFLWRFQPSLPATGGMTVYDRSWYGRLLVERVEGIINKETAKRSGEEIVQFERLLTDNDRASNPLKQWKLTPDDWRNREKRPQYLKALADMVDMTDQPNAHWDLIPAEDKHYARVAVLETLIQRWEHDLERRGFTLPAPRRGDYLK
jgi:polyphosphate kinase 2 (PPK2 family)